MAATRAVASALTLYNTLTRRLEEVRPKDPANPLMYTCGPTVYRDAHIGNLRSYLMADWIRRALEWHGARVTHVKNVTDVGHMRQEELERGEDKIIAAALAEGRTPAEIADFYTRRFLDDEAALNILPATHLPKATGHIPEMVQMIGMLLDRGAAYQEEGNVYFQVGSFAGYGELSGNRQDRLLEAVRVEADPLKRDPRDFTLWKAAEPGRALKWPSPWGDGFPGWHIECSAMSRRYLGERLDIHTGGVDNVFPHHEDERAQSEAAFGGPYARVWVHGQHLLADGIKMAKSAGNSYILSDFVNHGIEPLAFRYLCASAGYRSRLHFTLTALKAAQRGYTRLRRLVRTWADAGAADSRRQRPAVKRKWMEHFRSQVDRNLGVPQALATVWAMARSELRPRERVALVREFDRVLGLDLARETLRARVAPPRVRTLVRQRQAHRSAGRFDRADAVRSEIRGAGYAVQDTASGPKLVRLTPFERLPRRWPTISSSSEVPFTWSSPDAHRFTFAIQANGHPDDVRRCVESVLRHTDGLDCEVLVLDNQAGDAVGEYLESLSHAEPAMRVMHADLALGEATAKNALLRSATGRTVVLLETHVEVTGDLPVQLEAMLDRPGIGVAGPYGLRSEDLHHFHEIEGGEAEADAMQAYCFAFRRADLLAIGLLPESYRYYRNLDLELSFRFRDRGQRIFADPGLPVRRYEHRAWEALSEVQRNELSLANFRRFARRWGDRTDLLLSPARTHGSHHH